MKKQLQKLSSILLCFVMLLGLLPTTALADTYTKKGDISAVTATADIDPVLGATTYTSVTITDPTDAAAKGVIISGTSWYKKDASSIYGWTQCSNGVDTFEEGTYRLSVQLRSKSNDAKEYYAMSGDTTFTVNDVRWNSEEPFRDYYATDGYGYRFFVSPEFTLGGKTLDSIAVTTPPTKTAYREGEDFNPAGMVVTATYTDSTTAPVVLYTVTDGTAMAAGKTSVTISYTEGGVTKTTTQAITVAKEYDVTVNGGTGNGKKIAGEEVTISAFVPGGQKFKEWQGTDGLTFTSGDKNSQTATFTMPAHDVTVTAVTGPAEYYVSVSGGSGTGMYEKGETVTIVADAPEADEQFKEWSVGGNKVLCFAEGGITSSTAKFVMPGEAVFIYATYEDISVTTYDLWVGGTQVTEDNKGDILGDGKAKYDPDTKTLTLTGATLTNVYNDNDALIYVKDMELIINAPSGLTLDNTANDGPAILADGSYDLTVNGNVDLKADAAPAIVCGKNLTINGNTKVSSARSAVLTASFGSVTINGNATINSGTSAPGISAGADIVLNGSTHEVNSFLSGSTAVTITGDFKSTVTGSAPAINGKEVSITGKVDITSGNSLGIAASNKVSIKGDTKIEAKQIAISVNAGSVVLDGKKHELKSTEAQGISCSGDITIKGTVIATAGLQAINSTGSTGGTVTIDGNVTATSTTAPAITAKTIEVKSGTWTLSGNPLAMYAKSIVIPDTHEIVKPEGAKLNDEKTGIVEADGTTNVSNATIAPKAGATKTLDSIAITTPPAKTAYTAGETFDAAGMVVTATYSDHSTAPVTGYTVSPSGALSESDTQITVTYTEGGVTKTATQAITVTAASSSGGTGSSGGGGVTTHSITVDSTKNGTITVSPKSAVKGTTVTLTVDADKGYTLETLSVTDASGKEIELTNKGDGKYTFTMPASKVTVKATFMEDNTMLNYFVDVFATDYYYDAVLWAVGEGITNGTSATTFSPGAVCTRAQMATFLWRAAGSPDPVGNSNPFADVSEDTYYAKAVQWAYEQGITGGTSATTYSPDEPCTRGQMATFLCRVAEGKPVSDTVVFADIKADKYYAKSVQWAYEQKITVGTSATTFSPDDPCTRAQMVTFLYRYFMK